MSSRNSGINLARFISLGRGLWIAIAVLVLSLSGPLYAPHALAEETKAAEPDKASQKRKTKVQLLRADGASSPPPSIMGTPYATKKVINPFDPDDLRAFVDDVRKGTLTPPPPVACVGETIPDGMGGCSCPAGEVEVDPGICEPAPPPPPVCIGETIPDGMGGCTCPAGEVEVDPGVCEPAPPPPGPSCGPDTVPDGMGGCECPDPSQVETSPGICEFF